MDFDTVYEQYFSKVYNFIYSRVGNTQDTQDIVSLIFENIWHNFDESKDPYAMKNWIFAITKHKLIDFLRKKYKIRAAIQDGIDIDLEDYASEKVLSSGNIQMHRLLNQLLSQLTADENVFVQYRFRQSMTIREIAQKLSITENAAKVRQNRIIKRLQSLWTHPK